MSNQQFTKQKLIALCAIVTCLTMTLSLIWGHANEGVKKDDQGSALVSKEFDIDIPDFTKIQGKNVEDTVNRIEYQQRTMAKLLIYQLKNEKLSKASQAGIITLLGDMRSLYAIDILIQKINFYDDRPYPGTLLALQPRRGYIARAALEMIGSRASGAILQYIGAANSNSLEYPSLKDQTTVDGFAEVIYDVDGPRYGLLKLQDHQQAATSPQIKAQYQRVIDRFQKMVAQMQ